MTKLILKNINKNLILIIMSIIVISFGNIALANSYYISSVPPFGELNWELAAEKEQAGQKYEAAIGEVIIEEKGPFTKNDGTTVSHDDWEDEDFYFMDYKMRLLYNGKELYEIGEVRGNRIASPDVPLTIFGGTGGGSCIGTLSRVMRIPSSAKIDVLKQYLEALIANPNTPLTLSVTPLNTKQEGNWYSIPMAETPISGTWERNLLGDVSAKTALEVIKLLEEGKEEEADQLLINELPQEDLFTNFFENLGEAIAGMIYRFANWLFNIVQDGLRMVAEGTPKSPELVTIDKIVFDEYSETSIDFWENQKGSSFINKFKSNIEYWYNIFRGLALIGYLIVLLYIGVRILLAVGGRNQAKFKGMLLSWAQGVIILVLFPMVIRYSVQINHAIVSKIAEGKANREVAGSVNVTYPVSTESEDEANKAALAIAESPFISPAEKNDYMAAMAYRYENPNPNDSRIMIAIVYLIMIFQFIMILITYYKRLFMFSFLLAIFPIVALTYAIDKVGDGSAQAFTTWTKEIMMNVFMQCFHAIVYVFVLSVVFAGVGYGGDWLLTIVGITFLFKGEQILRSLLGQSGGETVKSVGETAARAMATIAVTQAISQKISNNFKAVPRAVRAEREARANRRIARDMKGEETRGRRFLNFITDTPNKSNPRWTSALNPRTGGVVIRLSGGGMPATDEGLEMLSAARIISDPIAEEATPQMLAQALDVVKKYEGSTNPEVLEIRQQIPLSDDQIKQMGQVQAAAATQLINADTLDEEKFRATLTKVNKDLEIRLSRILTGSRNATTSREVILWKRALLEDLKTTSSKQIREGLQDINGREQVFIKEGSRRVKELMSSKKQAEKIKDRFENLQDLINLDDREEIMARGGYFALDKQNTRLNSRATQEYKRLLKSIENDPEKRARIQVSDTAGTMHIDIGRTRQDRVYQRITKNMSDGDKKRLAINLAKFKDFGDRTHKTTEELQREGMENESVYGYSAEEMQDVVKELDELTRKNAGLQEIISSELGFETQELGEIVDNLVMISLPDGIGNSVVRNVESSIATENIRARAEQLADLQGIENAPEFEIMAKDDAVQRAVNTAKKVRKRVIERKERDIIYTIRNVGNDTPPTRSGRVSPETRVILESEGNNGADTRVNIRPGGRVSDRADGAGSGRTPPDRVTNRTPDRVSDRVSGGRTEPSGNINPVVGAEGALGNVNPVVGAEGTLGNVNPLAGDTAPRPGERRRRAESGRQTPEQRILGENASDTGRVTDTSRVSDTGRVSDRAGAVGEASTPIGLTSEGDLGLDSRVRIVTPAEATPPPEIPDELAPIVEEAELDRVYHKYRRTSVGKERAIDELFDRLKEDEEFKIRDLEVAGTHSNERLNIMGQLAAGDNREKVASLVDEVLEANRKVDENLLAERYEQRTADEYEAAARSGYKRAIQEALTTGSKLVTGTTLGAAGGFLNIGMSSKDSMLEEFTTGMIAGAALGEGASNVAYGGSGQKVVKVYNPYDGSLTDVKITARGGLLDGEAIGAGDLAHIMPLQDGEIIDLTDPRLDKVRTQVDQILADSAADKRQQERDRKAKARASAYKDALNSRNTK